MRHFYNFLPIALLVVLLTMLFGSSMAQKPNNPKKPRVLHITASDSIEVLSSKEAETIEYHINVNGVDYSETIDSLLNKVMMDVKVDTAFSYYFSHGGADKNMQIAIKKQQALFDSVLQKSGGYGPLHLQICDSGAVSTGFYMKSDTSHGFTSSSISMDFFNDSLVKYISKFKGDVNADSLFSFDFDFDVVADPINWNDTVFFSSSNNKPVSVKVVHKRMPDKDLIVVTDNGEEIQIERKGELIIMKKDGQVKDLDSDIIMEEGENGERIIVLQTRIVVNDLPKEEKEELSKKGIKSTRKELDMEYLKFYPNPSDGEVNVEFKLNEPGKAKLSILDMLGRVVYSEDIANTGNPFTQQIDMREHGAGTYFLQVQQGKRNITRKIIVE